VRGSCLFTGGPCATQLVCQLFKRKSASADGDEGGGHDAHLFIEERRGLRVHLDKVVSAADIEGGQVAVRVFGLAASGAEIIEIMQAYQLVCGFPHGLDVEGLRDVPDSLFQQRRRSRSIEDAVKIMARVRTEASMEGRRNRLGIDKNKRVMVVLLQMERQSVLQGVCIDAGLRG